MVLNASRHHSNEHLNVPTVVQVLDRCSTPHGITATSTHDCRPVTDGLVTVLNASRHHSNEHPVGLVAKVASLQCSTPHGITATSTAQQGAVSLWCE